MARRKLTGFARFFIALLIIIPISFGVSYLVTGESIDVNEVVQNLRDRATSNKTTDHTETEIIDNPTITDDFDFNALDSIANLNDTINVLSVKLMVAESEVKDLKNRLDERDKLRTEIDSLKRLISN